MRSFARLLRRLAAFLGFIDRLEPESLDLLRRRELCECGRWDYIDEMHLIIDAEDDPESGGGWVQSAAFCPAHCPGGCDHEEIHDRSHA